MSAPLGASQAYDIGLQALLGAGKINGLAMHNKSADTDYFILIFDQVTEPVDTEVPDWAPIPLEAGVYYESVMPREFKTGCWLKVSTTAETLTAAASEDVWISASVA